MHYFLAAVLSVLSAKGVFSESTLRHGTRADNDLEARARFTLKEAECIVCVNDKHDDLTSRIDEMFADDDDDLDQNIALAVDQCKGDGKCDTMDYLAKYRDQQNQRDGLAPEDDYDEAKAITEVGIDEEEDPFGADLPDDDSDEDDD